VSAVTCLQQIQKFFDLEPALLEDVRERAFG
jgi:hypothetical protein